MQERDIILEKINRNDADDIASGKIYDNDARLRTAVASAHTKADDNAKAITDLKKEINEVKTHKKEYINVSQYRDKYDYETKEAARNAVPEKLRAVGQVVVYRLKALGWKAEVFIGGDTAQWQVPECWRAFGSSSRIFDGGRADSKYGGARIITCGGASGILDGEIADCGGANDN